LKQLNNNIKWLHLGVAILLIGIAIYLLWLPPDYFDHGGKATCLSLILFDKECIGCGMTRAAMHLIHLDFNGALYYNALSFLVVPFLSFWYLKTIYSSLLKFKKS